MNDLSNIFTHSHCLSKEQLIGYMQQTLEREEVYLVETHMSDCEFCSDTFEGLIDSDLNQVQKSMYELEKKMQIKVVEYNNSVPSDFVNKGTLKIESKKSYRWMAAASIILLIGLGGYSVFSYMNSQKHQLALNEKTKDNAVEDVKYEAPTDSEANEIIHIEVKPEDLPKFKEAEKSVSTSKKNFEVDSKNENKIT
jgi:hypothetical protein